jgi:DNA-binding MarR family transcriptional regulator
MQAYREHGYRLNEIAAHLGVHYAPVSRKLKEMEQAE